MPATERATAPVSIQVPFLTAAKVPSPMPATAAKSNAVAASTNVPGKASPSISETGLLVR